MRTFTKQEIYQRLQEGILHVQFIKKDGSNRIMQATWNQAYLPSRDERVKLEEQQKDEAKEKEYVAVWDMSIGDWRSFRFDSVKAINGENVTYGKE